MEIKEDINNYFKPELLMPAGSFEALRAAVQNGADCIYFGADLFSARAGAKNFTREELKEAIEYCKLRNVKTNLTLNTLLLNSEFKDAVELAKYAYLCGIDAIIVQDLGLAKTLISKIPGLPIHGSTQMTVHNLEGVLELEKLGFSRVVLSRELPIREIQYIRKNSKVELEIFVHGALCISYSGQCLFSSLVGARSGNRGKCAQPCRLPYELVEKESYKGGKETLIDKGYLLSPKDLYSLDHIPELISLGVDSFKIEGRMKSPYYVGIVTRIYRKYIDLALSEEDYKVTEEDKKELMQAYNRGGFSAGHLESEPNKNFIFKEKPNNIGIYIGNISKYNQKGYITLKTNEKLHIGDGIAIDGETGKYTISELIKDDKNIKEANIKDVVTIGRMKGKIKVGSKVYKLVDKVLEDDISKSYTENANLKRIPIEMKVVVKKNKPIKISARVQGEEPFYNNVLVTYTSDVIPEESISYPITKERIEKQLSKLGDTPYKIDSIEIDMDNNMHIPSISSLNEVRRQVIKLLEEKITEQYIERRKVKDFEVELPNENYQKDNHKISLLLESINKTFDYTKLSLVNRIYIPLKLWTDKALGKIIKYISDNNDTYVYLPTITRPNYKNLFLNEIDKILSNYKVKGFVISNIGQFELLKSYKNNKYEFIGNYTLNVFNNNTSKELRALGIKVITPSIELSKERMKDLLRNEKSETEVIVYGRSVLMNTQYCPLGKGNKCYPECGMRCKNGKYYYLKDRMGYLFRIIPDNMQTVTSIYNSKITSIESKDVNSDYVRIDVIDENIDEINRVIKEVKLGKKLNGNEYTNGNYNRDV